jgi:D-hexose-6-phosphate mutarotase
LCFPWFGPKPDVEGAPLHGVARLVPWSLAEVVPAPGGLRATLELAASDYSRRFFPFEFALRLAVTVGRSLRLALEARNTGGTPFRFEEALHTYFAVGDVRQVEVGGLEGGGYLDKAAGGVRKVQDRSPLTIGAETDRVFTGHAAAITISDRAWRRRILVERTGSATAVVWNPWQAKALAMPDFGDEEWPRMLCVEAANALEDAVELSPGGSHTLTKTIEVRGGA